MKRIKINTKYLVVLSLVGFAIFQITNLNKYFPDDKSGDCSKLQVELILSEGKPFLKEWSSTYLSADDVEIEFDYCNYQVTDSIKEVRISTQLKWEKGMLLGEAYELEGTLSIKPQKGIIKKYVMDFVPRGSIDSSPLLKKRVREFEKVVNSLSDSHYD